MKLSKLLTFAQFDRVLTELGFRRIVLPDRKAVIYRHERIPFFFPMRPHRRNQYVPDYYLAGARSQLDSLGIIDAEEFEEMLRAAAAA